MAKGRPPKPTKLKLLEGNPGKRKINRSEPKPGKARGGVPVEFRVERAEPGEDLKDFKPPVAVDEAKKEFVRRRRELEALGLLTTLDVGLLEAYCQAYGMWREASAWVNKMGMITKTTNGNFIQNPYVAIVNKQQEIMRKTGAELGFSPSSRSRLEVKGGENEEDPMSALLNQRRTV